ncbi:hypothetical protein GI374_00470 [Paracoccus sp. S-4012]|uniref:hypothetical protein n=1 Tax=Paracoccus sp. S-4012 TaxID=2665648 RepID=UPI0012AF831E|nr:hypothetical protein [Paracoccus sp. S-4012]MRX48932.1 hypothetical protein [Paracoccus sp. S-4012]
MRPDGIGSQQLPQEPVRLDEFVGALQRREEQVAALNDEVLSLRVEMQRLASLGRAPDVYDPGGAEGEMGPAANAARAAADVGPLPPEMLDPAARIRDAGGSSPPDGYPDHDSP